MTITLKRKLHSLETIHQTIVDFVSRHALSDQLIFTLDLVVEELFVNAVKYHPENTHDISFGLSKEPDRLIITLTDYDVDSFDISKRGEYDPTKRLEERKVGGLGIPLVNKLMDEVQYEYENRRSKIILTKYLEDKHV
jgi:serine/threonine-protein kinase RsbW